MGQEFFYDPEELIAITEIRSGRRPEAGCYWIAMPHFIPQGTAYDTADKPCPRALIIVASARIGRRIIVNLGLRVIMMHHRRRVIMMNLCARIITSAMMMVVMVMMIVAVMIVVVMVMTSSRRVR